MYDLSITIWPRYAEAAFRELYSYGNLPGIALGGATVITLLHLSQMRERMRWMTRWSAWLCLSLMLWTVAAESTHQHARQTQSNSCSICVLAHSASPVSSAQARPVFAAVGQLQEEKIIAQARLHTFELSIRGPPAV
jgi:hypothetical protein